MEAQLSLIPVVLLAIGGVALTYFAYEITGLLLVLVGYAIGAGAGFGVGLVARSRDLVPALGTGNDALVVIGGAVVIGAILGRIIVPALSKLAVGALGFVTTALSALAVLTQGRVAEAIRVALPSNDVQAPPERLLEYVLAAPELQGEAFQQTLLIAGGIGLVGGLIAMAYYRAMMSIVLTGVGSLSLAGPVLLAVVTGSGAASVAPQFAPVWALAALVTGLLVQYARHSDDPMGAET
jgi:hypothetical protein